MLNCHLCKISLQNWLGRQALTFELTFHGKSWNTQIAMFFPKTWCSIVLNSWKWLMEESGFGTIILRAIVQVGKMLWQVRNFEKFDWNDAQFVSLSCSWCPLNVCLPQWSTSCLSFWRALVSRNYVDYQSWKLVDRDLPQIVNPLYAQFAKFKTL